VPHAATLYHPDLFAQLPALPQALKQRLACGRLSSDHPVAALRARAARVAVPLEHHLLALDLIHLYPDLNRVRLVLPEGMEGVRADEVEHLLDCCRPVFSEKGMQLMPAQGRYWLLSVPASHAVTDKTTAASFTDPQQAQGMPLDQALPKGESGRVWRQLVSELQIELHHAGVNQQRIQNGRLSLNGVWLWGWSTSADYQSLEDQKVIWLDEAHALEQIEAQMRDADSLRLCSDAGCWLWQANETWKFWRRRQARRAPFEYVAQEDV
jgi:hypothetical protein